MTAAAPDLVFFPVFEDAWALRDALVKAAWYLAPRLERMGGVAVPVGAELLAAIGSAERLLAEAPDYLAADAVAVAAGQAGRFHLFDGFAPVSWGGGFGRARTFLCWNQGAMVEQTARHSFLFDHYWGKRSLNVDRIRNQLEAYEYVRLASECDADGGAAIARSRQRLGELVAAIRAERPRKCYVLLSGPSLQSMRGHDFSDGVALVCNNLLLDQDLLDQVRPRFVSLVDDVLHAGCIAHAAPIRAALARALRRFPDLHLITRASHRHLYQAVLDADLHDRVIGLPVVHNLPINLDLAARFYVKELANVLTVGLLPLATTLCDQVHLAGCDGRPPERTETLWPYDARISLEHLMFSYDKAHPALYRRDGQAYEARHAQNVADFLEQAENAGKQFLVRTPSFIPALARRRRDP